MMPYLLYATAAFMASEKCGGPGVPCWRAQFTGHGCRSLCVGARGFCSGFFGSLAPCIRVCVVVRRHDRPELRACLGGTKKTALVTFVLRDKKALSTALNRFRTALPFRGQITLH